MEKRSAYDSLTRPTARCTRFAAGAILLATGGLGQIYRETTNPDVATGDGMAIAYEAGAVLSDMEFVQFHPTALAVKGAPRFLFPKHCAAKAAFCAT